MADIFDLDKGGNQKRIMTSHNKQTKLKIDSQSIRLVQDATVQYQQRTEARFEVGFEHIYWAVGQSQGSMTCNKLVAQTAGVFEGLEGALKDGAVNAAKKFRLETENGSVKGDCVAQSATVSFNVGDMAISDNTTWSVGDMTLG